MNLLQYHEFVEMFKVTNNNIYRAIYSGVLFVMLVMSCNVFWWSLVIVVNLKRKMCHLTCCAQCHFKFIPGNGEGNRRWLVVSFHGCLTIDHSSYASECRDAELSRILHCLFTVFAVAAFFSTCFNAYWLGRNHASHTHHIAPYLVQALWRQELHVTSSFMSMMTFP